MEALKALYNPRSAHFYGRDGSPRYEVERADGKGIRPPTIKDARAGGWLPSVTNILQVWPRPGLDIYKRKQDLLAAMTLPRLPDEGDEAFCTRVIADAEAHANTAADFGTHAHKLFELVLNCQEPTERDLLGPALPWYPHIRAWCDKNIQYVHWTEKILVHNGLGFGCRADAMVEMEGRLVLMDFKTQAVRKQPMWYDTWIMQLAACSVASHAAGDFIEPSLMSVVLDSGRIGEPVFLTWTRDDERKAWEDFMACFELWKRVKQYDPGCQAPF